MKKEIFFLTVNAIACHAMFNDFYNARVSVRESWSTDGLNEFIRMLFSDNKYWEIFLKSKKMIVKHEAFPLNIREEKTLFFLELIPITSISNASLIRAHTGISC